MKHCCCQCRAYIILQPGGRREKKNIYIQIYWEESPSNEILHSHILPHKRWVAYWERAGDNLLLDTHLGDLKGRNGKQTNQARAFWCADRSGKRRGIPNAQVLKLRVHPYRRWDSTLAPVVRHTHTHTQQTQLHQSESLYVKSHVGRMETLWDKHWR